MGSCSSTRNQTQNIDAYDNFDLIHLDSVKPEQPMFSKESETLLNELQRLTNITPTRFHSIILGSERVPPTPTRELQRLTKSIKHKIPTPDGFSSSKYMKTMKRKLCNKTLIELCDISRHLHNISQHNICVINLGAEIQRHFCTQLPLLHSTIHLLHDIGFRSPSKQSKSTPKWNLCFKDLSYCEDILWLVEFEIHKRKPVTGVYELGKSDAMGKWLVNMFDGCMFARTNLCLNNEGQEILNKIDEMYWSSRSDRVDSSSYVNRNEILVVGYLKYISLSSDIPHTVSEQCQLYYPAESLSGVHRNSTHISHLSVINNRFKLNLYDTKRDQVCHIDVHNIKGQHNKHNNESILFMVQNTSIPHWITDQYKDEWMDLNLNIYRNREDLALLFVKSVEYDNYVIVIDSGGGYDHGYSVAMPSGTAVVSDMYSCSNRNILCMDDESVMCDYNIDLDEYNPYVMTGDTYHGALPKRCAQNTFGCGIVAFDDGNTVFKCGGMDLVQSQIKCDEARALHVNKRYHKSKDIMYSINSYYNQAHIIKLDRDSLSGEHVQGTARMHVSKAYFGMLYVNALKRVVAGPGGQTLVSMHVVETYDIVKNKWCVIGAKTHYQYQSVTSLNHRSYKRSFLWTSDDNPFVIHLCNGKDYAEWIDIRNPKKWMPNKELNAYLEQHKLHATTDGHVFM
eukprot:102174_1